MDRNGLLLAVRSDKVAYLTTHDANIFCQFSISGRFQTGSHIQVFNYEEGGLHSVIDSHGVRLRRPTGERTDLVKFSLNVLNLLLRHLCGRQIRLHRGHRGGLH